MSLKSPHCPHCYNGYIVKDKYNVFFCNRCMSEVEVKIFDGKRTEKKIA